MAKCQYCGRELATGESCTCSAGAEMKEKDYFRISVEKDTVKKLKKTVSAAAEAVSARSEAGDFSVHAVDHGFENGYKIVDQCIVPTEQEIPIRQYNIARLNTPLWKRANGRLQVTNKRILFRSTGKSLAGPVVIEKEFSMEEMGGIEIKTDYRFDLLLFVLYGLAVLLIGAAYSAIMLKIIKAGKGSVTIPVILSVLTVISALACCFIVARKRVLKTALLFCSGIGILLINITSKNVKFWIIISILLLLSNFVMLIYSAIVDDLQIIFKIKGAHPAIEISRKVINDERSGFKIVQPWTDTDVAVRELGALIDDVKRFGDAGIAKWKV